MKSLGTQEEQTEGMKRQARDLIDQAYQKGFKAGVEYQKENYQDTQAELIEQGRDNHTSGKEQFEAINQINAVKNAIISRNEVMILNSIDNLAQLTYIIGGMKELKRNCPPFIIRRKSEGYR